MDLSDPAALLRAQHMQQLMQQLRQQQQLAHGLGGPVTTLTPQSGTPAAAESAPASRTPTATSPAVKVSVVCGGRQGTLQLPERLVECKCAECCSRPVRARLMKCPAFEVHGGRASSKKWVESLRVSSSDAAAVCGREQPSVKAYLTAKGIDLKTMSTTPPAASLSIPAPLLVNAAPKRPHAATPQLAAPLQAIGNSSMTPRQPLPNAAGQPVPAMPAAAYFTPNSGSVRTPQTPANMSIPPAFWPAFNPASAATPLPGLQGLMPSNSAPTFPATPFSAAPLPNQPPKPGPTPARPQAAATPAPSSSQMTVPRNSSGSVEYLGSSSQVAATQAASQTPATQTGAQPVTQPSSSAVGPSPAAQPASAGGQAEEVKVAAARASRQFSDHRHQRYKCGSLRFDSSPHEAYCANCYCMVCNEPAPCPLWGEGDNQRDHCHAHEDDAYWVSLQAPAKERRKAKAEEEAEDEAEVKPEAAETSAHPSAPQVKGEAGAHEAFMNDDGFEELQSEELDGLHAMMENLKAKDSLHEVNPPEGALKATLHPYQKQSLAWMLKNERGQSNRGGLLADEQGLGKTVQMLALIVSKGPAPEDARKALDRAKRQQDAMQLHPLGSAARLARAAQLGVSPSPLQNRSSSLGSPAGSDGGGSGLKRKASAMSGCGRGPACNCMICKSVREKRLVAARAEVKEAEKQRKAVRDAQKRAAEAGPVLHTPAPIAPTLISPDGQAPRRTLVVCPLAVASQWMDELHVKTPQLSTILYHGPGRSQYSTEILASTDVVVTTYDIVVSEHNASPNGPLFRINWYRCILDEAHIIRNRRTLVSQASCALQALNRWVLTGTPIVNQAGDVFALFCFLQYRPFCDIMFFNSKIRNKIQRVKTRTGRTFNPSESNRKQGYAELRVALDGITLRRVKTQLINGKPIVVLPSKTTNIVELEFSDKERDFYKALEGKHQQRFLHLARNVGNNYANILVLLLRLRQACIHPSLAQTGDKDGTAAEGDNQQSDRPDGGGLTPEKTALLLSKLASGMASECPVCMDAVQDAVVSICSHGPFCRECLSQCLTSAESSRCPLCRGDLTTLQVYGIDDLAPRSLHKKARSPVIAIDGAESDDDSGDDSGTAMKEADAELAAVGEFDALASSTKFDAVLSQLRHSDREDKEANEANSEGEPQVTKTLIFSYFTKALDGLSSQLDKAEVQYKRLDGQMGLPQRADAIRRFRADPEVRVLLCSTKAASLGLNLECACRVIILDVWWNGAYEDQAADRCHRLGQTRPVQVTKFVMKSKDMVNTVEQRIVVMQDEKRAIAEAALSSGSAASASRLSMRDLYRLFGLQPRGGGQRQLTNA